MSFPDRPNFNRLIRQSQNAFRRELAAGSQEAAARLVSVYRGVNAQIERALGPLERQASGQGMTGMDLVRIGTSLRLRETVQEALDGLTGEIERQARMLERSGAAAGREWAARTLERLGQTTFARPSVEMLESMIRIVDSPAFRALLDGFGAFYGQRAADWLLHAASRGENPLTTARRLRTYLKGMPLADAVRAARTTQLWAARLGTREMWRANGDVVKGWWWSCAQDLRVCASCWAMHGSQHSTDEVLNDHHLGRCAMMPMTATWRELGLEDGTDIAIERGEDIVRAMPEADQQQILGKARWMAWRDGLFGFGQLSTTYQTPIFGEMRREASLESLIGQAAVQYRQMARELR